jgi:predicted ATP-dependent serine protease
MWRAREMFFRCNECVVGSTRLLWLGRCAQLKWSSSTGQRQRSSHVLFHQFVPPFLSPFLHTDGQTDRHM